MSNKMKLRLIGLLGLIISIVPPLATTLVYFPFWCEKSNEAAISGGVLFLGIICLVPLYKKLGQSFRSPSAPVMWGMLAVFMYAMKSIAEQVYVIAIVGTISNLIGVLIFKLKKRYKIGGGT